MARLFEWSLACVLACAVGCTGKPKNGGAEEAGDRPAGELSGDGPSAPASDDRIPLPGGAALGAHPGHLPDAFLYASVELGALHSFLAALPLDARTIAELDELGQRHAVHLRGPKLLTALGVEAEAKLSLSVRLVDSGVNELREAWTQPSPALAQLRQHGLEIRQGADTHAEPSEAGESPTPAPTALGPAAAQLEAQAQHLGALVRVHLPVRDMGFLRTLIHNEKIHAGNNDARWAETCADVGPDVVACGGESDSVFVLREHAGGLQLDALLTFVGDYETPDDPLRRATLKQALSLGAATPAAVADLRGQVGVSVDGPGMVALMRAESVARAINNLASGWSDGAERQHQRDEALARLHQTERLFAGISIEGELGADAVALRGRWLPTPQAHARAASIFALSEVDADVPTLASLCTGALICARSRGVPRRERFAPLAQGLYAEPRALERLANRFEDDAATLALLETWPNMIGTTSLVPGTLVGPAESLAINNALGVLSRVLGFGLSIRSLDEVGRGLSGDYVAYARMSAADLASVSGMLQFAEVSPTPTVLDGVRAQVNFAPLPGRELAGNYYALAEPDAGAGAWGWAVLADGDDRVRWLADRAHDDGAKPLLYAEIGDLWRLVASFREGRRELEFARTWLTQRWVRAQVDLGEDGMPELRVAMGKR